MTFAMGGVPHAGSRHRFFSRTGYYKKGFSGSSVGKESACSVGDWFDSWVGKIRWSRERLPTPVFLGFLCGTAGQESACNVGDLGVIPGSGRSPGGGLGVIPGLGRSPGGGKGSPLQYSSLENAMDYIELGLQRVRRD